MTADELGGIALFGELGEPDRELLCRAAADLSLMPGEYAAHERDERALFAVLEGRIEAVKTVDGIERVVGERLPGEVFGEVPIVLGTVFPVGFRAAEESRIMRLEPGDFHTIAAAAPDIAKEVGRLAAHRMTGPRGLQGIAADPPPPRAVVVGHRWDAACTDLRHFLDRNQVTFRWITSETDDPDDVWGGPVPVEEDWPAIRVIGGKTVIRPHHRRVAELLGLGTEAEVAEYDAVVVGAGPGDSPRRSTVRRRAFAPSSWNARHQEGRPAPPPGSRTTWASRPASRATSSPAARSSRHAGSVPRSW